MDLLTLKFNDNTKVPLYKQLYLFISNEIKQGKLKYGERLPSKRILAEHLKISKNTVETAYDMLLSEGYIKSISRSGFFVNKLEELQPVENLITKFTPPRDTINYIYNFSANAVDTTQFPLSTWAKLSKEIVYNNHNLLNFGEKQGEQVLREAIAMHLREFRGVNCHHEQIIIGSGIEQLLGMLSEILGNESLFAIENPGYAKTYEILSHNNKKVCFIDIDSKGMKIDDVIKSKADISYITPSHQYPIGIVMPIDRRIEFLNWASKSTNRYIIEDDYDSEFQFDGKPIPALQGLDSNGKVIYLGSFSRSIAPAVRIAYLVLPSSLLQKWRNFFIYYSEMASRFEQHTIAKFITGHYYSRYLNKIRLVYKKKRDFLIKTLKESALGDKIEITGKEAGLHFLLKVNNGMSEDDLVKSAFNSGVKMIGFSKYYYRHTDNVPESTVVLGYADFNEQDILDAVKILETVWNY